MGVRSLQSFIKANSGIALNVQFGDSSIVIDANNLMCFLFSKMVGQGEQKRCDIYGGDMVTYGLLVKEFFDNLDKCNITPVLVFDGSVIGKQSMQIASKERDIYQRGLERFQMVKNMTESAPDERICLPQVISNVFKNITTDLGLQKIQTPYEADSHVARVANELNCPALTNDSDFLIYPLNIGFILIDSFFYENPIRINEQKFCINCSIYSQDRLMKCIPGLKKETLPLLSVILGNDYVEPGTFDKVTEPIFQGYYNGPLVATSYNHRKIAKLLTWLRAKTLEEALHFILDQINSKNRTQLEKTIRVLLRSYKIEQTDNFEEELELVFPPNKGDPNLNIHPELMPPAYLRRLMETTDLNPSALDIVFHNTNYNYPIVDDFSLPSSSIVRYRPYSMAVTLLRPRSYLNMTTYRRQIESEKDAACIYDRLQGEYKKIIVRPLESLDSFGSLEHLTFYSTITLLAELKKSLLTETFRFNMEELNLMTDTMSRLFKGDYVHESSMCLMLVKYIGLETKLAPKPQFVDALILTFFYYAAINGQLNQEKIKDDHYGKILLRLRPHSIKNNGIEYDQSPNLYRRIVHFIAQLQVAYNVFSFLNSLLNCVYPKPRLERFMNGTLIFRLTKLLRLQELKFKELCHEIPLLCDISDSVKVLVHCD